MKTYLNQKYQTSDVADFFSNLFTAGPWTTRWESGKWSAFHGWLHITSDLLTGLAYFAIPIIILRYLLQKNDIRFHKAYILFAVFIFACGITHFLDALVFWVPVHRLNTLAKLITAIASCATVYYLVKILPVVIRDKTLGQMKEEMQKSEVLRLNLEKSNSMLKAQREFTEKVLDATLEYILVFDTSLNVLSVNQNSLNVLKTDKQSLVGRHYDALFPTTLNSPYHLNLLTASKGEVVRNKESQGLSGRFYNSSFIPLFENDSQYAVMVVSCDITGVREKEQELKNLNESLNIKNDQLQYSNSELEQMGYVLSHDLQEPLRKIQIYSDRVIEKNEDTTSKVYLEKIIASANRMQTLIKDVLNYSRVSKYEKPYTNVKLNDILEEVKVDFELKIQERQARIEAGELPI